MPQVSIQIANRSYELACGDGEEERVQELAAYVDEKVCELRKQLPGAPEIKLMVFASLLLAEESREARGRCGSEDQKRPRGERASGAVHIKRGGTGHRPGVGRPAPW